MISINEERTNARVEIAEDVNGLELELLIHQMADARCRLAPAVSTRKPMSDGDDPAIVYRGGSFEVRAALGGHCELWVRHAGLGWVSCDVPVAGMLALRDFFVAGITRERIDGMSVAYDDRTRAVRTIGFA